MKKIILVLMFSLGLVNATNIDAVCGEGEELYIKDRILDLAYDIVGLLAGNEHYETEKSKQKTKIYNALNSLIYSHHSKEFKIDNKESFCAYMNVYDLSFLNTQLTQDDIEQFERYMAEKGAYNSYENYKELYLQVLKLFKYYHKYIPSYKTIKKLFIDSIAKDISQLKKHNGEIILQRYVYGKNQSGFYVEYILFDDFKKEIAKMTKCSEATANSKEELAECAKNKKVLPSILKWAESTMKQKPKDS